MTGDMACRYLLVDAAEVPEGDGWLAPSEADFQQRLHIPHRRADWRLGRWAAKKALAAWRREPLAPHRIAVHPAPDGAPEILLDGAAVPIALSFSHRADRALCTLAPAGTRLGCDLELIEPRTDAFVRDYLTAAEIRTVEAAPASARPLLANLLWSAKESALKALRTGLRMDTREVEVCLEENSRDGSHWTKLSVRCINKDDRFAGWWRQDGDHLLTVCTSPPLEEPEIF